MKSYDRKETAAGILAGIIAAALFLVLLFAVRWNLVKEQTWLKK